MPTALWLIKLAVFFLTSYITARMLLKFFLKRNSNAAASDPEIIALSVISGAVATGLVMFVVKRII
ncbi:MAG TPA: hypothetical protein PK514_12550 [Spirochaetota bacterium]|nr:hypothetical protein [Spirochaetota bacterium]